MFLNTLEKGYGKKDSKLLKIHQKGNCLYGFGNNPNHREITNFKKSIEKKGEWGWETNC